ncbi:MAG TPA: type II toxin-antitoxin system RelE/ParE family toxin [Anaerovoracaceae bacterium]|nr:type II toxin-antitoxin system RelE/ParE family toxin [Anaerovoracaceae bacterium]
MVELRFLPPAKNYIKKIPDKKLKEEFRNAIDKICRDYTIGEPKSGDLDGIYGYDFFYNKTNYEIAYTIRHEENKVIVVIMAGTRENFYQELKRYMKKEKQL